MYIRIRNVTSKNKTSDLTLNISKKSLIQDLRKMIFDKLNIEKQVLYYKGKQLIDDHRVLDYKIQLNDVIQLVVQNESLPHTTVSPTKNEPTIKTDEILVQTESQYYRIGDKVDVIDNDYGAWFEATILEILTKGHISNDSENDLVFKIQAENYRNEETAPLNVTFADIRPRAHYTYAKSELQPEMIVLANYNTEDPLSRGYWYDFKISTVKRTALKGTLLIGRGRTNLEGCVIKFHEEVMKIEQPTLVRERTEVKTNTIIPLRKMPFYCNVCKDRPERKCKECGCFICSLKTQPSQLILCDECDRGYHFFCLNPPLTENPPEPEWYCPNCKTDENEIVKAGEKLKISKKKIKKESAGRDWGQGMACVGRTKECTIVPKTHYGPIPGVAVGTCWKFRMQVSEAGVHRPAVAGIHGRGTDAAYSLVLSGGYEDDIDNGNEFFYTGSGGRDLSGNKRVNGQSSDQELTRMNKSLALSCNVKFNDRKGGEARNWKGGKPVRVVRNFNLRKHSKYAPISGNRYDGIYKVVKYYPERGKSGFIVWRYLLRRDDPTPAPWEEGGQEFKMIFPPGYLDASRIAENEESPKTNSTSKRKLRDSSQSSIKSHLEITKKPKNEKFEISPKIQKLISDDVDNVKLWNESKEVVVEGIQKFLDKVQELFTCVCCLEVVYEPITLKCKHNVCKGCLKRSFGSEIYVCPCCRCDLGKDYVVQTNNSLASALKLLFPGYESGR